MFAAFALMLAGGPAGAEPPVRAASAAQFAAAAQACARHLRAYDVDTTGIEADGWKALPADAWHGRVFPSSARLFSRGDGVLLEVVTPGQAEAPHCTVFARRGAGQAFADVDRDLTSAFGVEPALRRSDPPRPSTLWVANRILFLLIPDKSVPDVMNIAVGPQGYDTPLTKTDS